MTQRRSLPLLYVTCCPDPVIKRRQDSILVIEPRRRSSERRYSREVTAQGGRRPGRDAAGGALRREALRLLRCTEGAWAGQPSLDSQLGL